MTDNPFRSPSLPAEPPRNEQGADYEGRPLGVSILAVFLLFVGLSGIAVHFLMHTNFNTAGDALRTDGLPLAVLFAEVLLLIGLAISTGLGMWAGAKWGWWLGAFYYMYSIFRNVFALAAFVIIAGQFEAGQRGLDDYFTKYGVRIVIQLLLFLYFFKGNVLAYFGLQNLNKTKAAGMIVVVSLLISAVLSGLSMVWI